MVSDGLSNKKDINDEKGLGQMDTVKGSTRTTKT